MLNMHAINGQAAGIALLRCANGLFLLTHGAFKLAWFPPAKTMQFFESLGLPGQLGFGVLAGELVFGICLLLGYRTRLAALGGMVILLGAIMPHWGNGFLFSNAGGGWEYPLFWALALAAQALAGPGSSALLDPSQAENSKPE